VLLADGEPDAGQEQIFGHIDDQSEPGNFELRRQEPQQNLIRHQDSGDSAKEGVELFIHAGECDVGDVPGIIGGDKPENIVVPEEVVEHGGVILGYLGKFVCLVLLPHASLFSQSQG
jgi:hypothetical protein